MSDWIAIAMLDEIPTMGARKLQTETQEIAVFRTGSDKVFAVRDRCPHRGGPLSQGIVYGDTVSCPLHNWKIDLQSGEVQGPDDGCVDTYAVKVDEGVVYLNLAQAESVA